MKKLLLLTRIYIIAAGCLFLLPSCNKYMKMNPPGDADKPGGVGTDNSCYLATAANMLAGAGYGDGTTLQERTDDIYDNLTTQFGIANGGWTDVALSWWLGSTNNTWSGNPYTVVTVYGNKSPKNPWANANGTQFYANELRKCCFVGLSISWPTAGSSIGSGGHAITAWGDNFGKNELSLNPNMVFVTDSDRDAGGDVQEYDYDDYTNPNPSGANEGNGWYMDYSNNHPYIKHIITLCPTDDPTDFTLTQKVTGSYKLEQNSQEAATDLHYDVSTDVEILSYRTWLDWDTENDPVITESGSPRDRISVDWDLTDNPVPQGEEVTVTTEFVLPSWNAMHYSNVYYTYPGDGDRSRPGPQFADLNWRVITPQLSNLERLPNNVTGGFVIGSFELVYSGENNERILLPYRFVHEYSYNQTPEIHTVQFTGREGAQLQNLRVGHSWNYPEGEQLWQFNNWMTAEEETMELGREPVQIRLDWQGRLPYPEGENIYEAIPENDGEQRKPDEKR
jgi:hypothetical protein